LVDVINGEDPFFVGGIPSAADLFFFEEEDGEHGWGEVARAETRFKNPESRGRNLNREWTQMAANQFLGIDRLIFSGVLSSSASICVHLRFEFLIG